MTDKFMDGVCGDINQIVLELIVENGRVNYIFTDGSSLLFKAVDSLVADTV